MAEAAAAELEAQYAGFKACFGGEELKRACATLAGALVSNKAQASPLRALAEDADLHVRELAFAAQQYAAALVAAPRDYDSLYNHGLVLQELSGRLAPASAEQIAFLRQACERYEAALALRPRSHQALYNWGVALSDLARALKPSAPADAAACLHLASQKYAASLAAAPSNPQALNNWGLVLQELSADARDWRTRDELVRAAMAKFRQAIRSRPDFDRGCYNLGTVFYSFACALQSEQGQPKDAPPRAGRDVAARAAFACAAQYIALAAALAPGRDIYRKSLAVVRPMLPLPFLRAGFLTAPLPRGLGGLCEVHRREWFVLDHTSLRAASHMESTLSAAAGQGLLPHSSGAAAAAAAAAEGDPLVIELSDVVAARRCADPSLPEGDALWVGLGSRPLGIYLVADSTDAADAWVDALVLAQHLVASGCQEALAEALMPTPGRRAKAAAAAATGSSPRGR